MPRFFGRTDFDNRVFFDDTLNAIRYSQKLAVATGCNIRFYIETNSYTVLRDDSCTSGLFNSSLATYHPATSDLGYSGSQTGVSLTAVNANTTFDPLGRVIENTDNIISVASRQITVVAETGFSYDSTP